jgi:uncharacterized protein with FMN-binding domain
MRRALPVLLATLGALALLAGFHTTPSHPASVAALAPTSTEPSTTDQRSTPAGAPPASPTTTTTRRTVDGKAVYTKFGDVQVRVVLAGVRIVDVQPLQMPFDHQRSQLISDRAGPWLHDEALQAQSPDIDVISGATYTSEAYRTSLQSALDRAGIR